MRAPIIPEDLNGGPDALLMPLAQEVLEVTILLIPNLEVVGERGPPVSSMLFAQPSTSLLKCPMLHGHPCGMEHTLPYWEPIPAASALWTCRFSIIPE